MSDGANLEAITKDRHAAEAIECLHEGRSDAAILRALGDVFGIPEIVSRFGPGRVSRAAAIVTTNLGVVLVLSAGVNNRTRFALLEGYTILARVQRLTGINAAAAEEAVTRYVGTLDLLTQRRRELYLYGHSGGGVVCEALAKLANNRAWADSGSVVTFGAPKPGTAGGTGVYRSMTHRRWINVGDPVPGIPFYRMAGSFASSITSVLSARSFANMSQAPDGLITAEDIDLARVGRNLVRLFENLNEVIDWGTKPDLARLHPHRIQTYVHRLTMSETIAEVAAAKALSGPTQATTIPHRPRPAVMASSNLVPAFVLNVGGVATYTVNPPGVATAFVRGGRGSDMSTFIPVELRPKHQNVGGIWCVVWLTQIVGRFPTATKARTHARGLYRAARTMLATSLYYEGAQALAWATFIQAAATAGSGIRPTITVE